jgi:hypothetical protein
VSVAEAVTREAVLRTLLDTVESEYKAVRAQVQELLDAEAKATGLNGVDARLPDGTKVAKVSISAGEAAATVVDQAAFLAWVRANRKDQIHAELVVTVREAFQTALLAQMTASKTAQWCDEDGVLHDVPGIAFRPARARTHSVRFTDSGRADVAAAWRTGQLTELVTLALPAAE